MLATKISILLCRSCTKLSASVDVETPQLLLFHLSNRDQLAKTNMFNYLQACFLIDYSLVICIFCSLIRFSYPWYLVTSILSYSSVRSGNGKLLLCKLNPL